VDHTETFEVNHLIPPVPVAGATAEGEVFETGVGLGDCD
jgi:hypothetical protein